MSVPPGVASQVAQAASVRVDDVDLVVAVAVADERDPSAVR